jgi:uncharacterized protein
VLQLAGEGATVPFMARYRKEKTGNLDEVQIRDILHLHAKFIDLAARREFILQEIAKQGNMTAELQTQIEAAEELAALEELYRPFKKKKKTKATLAREAGLQPLAEWIWALGQGEASDSTTLEIKAKEFINTSAGFVTYEEVLRGAQHILIERLYMDSGLRAQVRDEAFDRGVLKCSPGPQYKKNSKFEMYEKYAETAKNLTAPKSSHRYLALRRGWQEEELKVVIEVDEAKLLGTFLAVARKKPSQADAILEEAAKAALTVHVLPSVTNEMHTQLKQMADEHAIHVFANNVRKVLLSSPFGAKIVVGVDPGLRTGSKIALIDKSGHYVSSTVINILDKDAEERAKKMFEDLLRQIKVDAFAVGNGTAGRETQQFLRKILQEMKSEIPVVMVNEAGASVYSASEVAREEFPELDVTVKGAISIARRLQDPLAELVKIDPKSIGVGQYQHDVDQAGLKKSLEEVVESCVNQVGVNLNTASASLLQYVSGIGPALARNIVEYRKKVGLFEERADLLKVEKFGNKAFEQSAGFLRLPNGRIPLDATGIHPERYSAVKDMANEAGVSVSSLIRGDTSRLEAQREKWTQLVGEFTFQDILRELKAPGRDPRDHFKVFQYRDDIHQIADLKEGMVCPGLVTNVTNFGAFVDIGVHQDGLVHISELSHEFIDDPKKVVSPGDQVQVKVLGVDLAKNQIALSMLLTEAPAKRPAPRPRPSEPSARDQRPKRSDRGPRPRSKEADRSSGKGARPSGSGGGQRPTPRPRPAFNNPFAALKDIKTDG